MIDTATEFGARAARRLSQEPIIWLTTVRHDGTPQPSPVWFLWDGESVLIYSQPATQKLRNIARNPHVALTTGTNRWKEGLDLVVEGEAVQITDDSRLRTLADLWRSKYHGDWDFAVENGMFHHEDGGSAFVFEVSPTKVLAFAKGGFAQTRYRF